MNCPKNIRDFVKQLKQSKELVQIDTLVSANLEITEITDRVSKEQGFENKALLFTNVEGYDMPVLINSFGSYKRMQMALGVDSFEEIQKYY